MFLFSSSKKSSFYNKKISFLYKNNLILLFKGNRFLQRMDERCFIISISFGISIIFLVIIIVIFIIRGHIKKESEKSSRVFNLFSFPVFFITFLFLLWNFLCCVKAITTTLNAQFIFFSKFPPHPPFHFKVIRKILSFSWGDGEIFHLLMKCKRVIFNTEDIDAI